ncbi:SWIM zinc finger family protein [Hydrocoleum sp. CS-953]|uniref:SWIM zinc finger family protein n=1 Tax=Hydrocoleum sp. CS-953 TaxID=1671698 RepID=UPI001FEF6565|nr:SWIM zinc finger family protein [Hydrocoleum sp. CS-953]
MERLRFANEREESANRFLQENAVEVNYVNDINGVLSIEGSVRDRGRIFSPSLSVDRDERIIEAQCNCNWYQQNKLYQGPCEHILALRMQQARQNLEFRI